MRKVPFEPEQQLMRAKDDEAQARGNLIDDVLSTQNQPSSWDDLVDDDYSYLVRAPLAPDQAKPASIKPAQPKPVPKPVPKPLPKAIPAPKPAQPKPAGLVTYADGAASLDWQLSEDGKKLHITLCGILDHTLGREWRDLISAATAADAAHFEFNLGESSELTLAGLGMLLVFKEKTRAALGDIRLQHCNKEVWQMLHWTGMDKYFTIQGTSNI